LRWLWLTLELFADDEQIKAGIKQGCQKKKKKKLAVIRRQERKFPTSEDRRGSTG